MSIYTSYTMCVDHVPNEMTEEVIKAAAAALECEAFFDRQSATVTSDGTVEVFVGNRRAGLLEETATSMVTRLSEIGLGLPFSIIEAGTLEGESQVLISSVSGHFSTYPYNAEGEPSIAIRTVIDLLSTSGEAGLRAHLRGLGFVA